MYGYTSMRVYTQGLCTDVTHTHTHTGEKKKIQWNVLSVVNQKGDTIAQGAQTCRSLRTGCMRTVSSNISLNARSMLFLTTVPTA
jgi:hypothetical protein